MTVEGNAPIVTLTLKRIDGTSRPTRFVFDSGGGAIILDEGLADDLGLKSTGEPINGGGVRFLPTAAPVAQFGSMTVKLDSSKAFIHMGKVALTHESVSMDCYLERLWNTTRSCWTIQINASASHLTVVFLIAASRYQAHSYPQVVILASA